MVTSLKKIDKNGNYCRFPGVSVISGILDRDIDLWRRVNDCIAGSEFTRRHYSALPYESYHMTLLDLFTENVDGGDDWEVFIQGRLPFFQALHARLEEKKIIPELTINSVHFSSVIQLVLALPEEQQRIIHEVAEEFGLKHKVPSVFHLTLAYQYKPLSREDSEHIKHHTLTQINALFKSCGYKIELKSPVLSCFDDMTCFYPWHGDYYPFNTAHSTPGI